MTEEHADLLKLQLRQAWDEFPAPRTAQGRPHAATLGTSGVSEPSGAGHPCTHPGRDQHQEAVTVIIGERPPEGLSSRQSDRLEQDMDWKERIVIDDDVLSGKPIIRGTRMSVEFVVDLLGRGWTVEQVLQEYDHITSDDIQACLAYAGDVLKSERVYPVPGT